MLKQKEDYITFSEESIWGILHFVFQYTQYSRADFDLLLG
jgi:hypothetical protein